MQAPLKPSSLPMLQPKQVGTLEQVLVLVQVPEPARTRVQVQAQVQALARPRLIWEALRFLRSLSPTAARSSLLAQEALVALFLTIHALRSLKAATLEAVDMAATLLAATTPKATLLRASQQ